MEKSRIYENSQFPTLWNRLFFGKIRNHFSRRFRRWQKMQNLRSQTKIGFLEQNRFWQNDGAWVFKKFSSKSQKKSTGHQEPQRRHSLTQWTRAFFAKLGRSFFGSPRFWQNSLNCVLEVKSGFRSGVGSGKMTEHGFSRN